MDINDDVLVREKEERICKSMIKVEHFGSRFLSEWM